jgi:hypothetical protein
MTDLADTGGGTIDLKGATLCGGSETGVTINVHPDRRRPLFTSGVFQDLRFDASATSGFKSIVGSGSASFTNCSLIFCATQASVDGFLASVTAESSLTRCTFRACGAKGSSICMAAREVNAPLTIDQCLFSVDEVKTSRLALVETNASQLGISRSLLSAKGDYRDFTPIASRSSGDVSASQWGVIANYSSGRCAFIGIMTGGRLSLTDSYLWGDVVKGTSTPTTIPNAPFAGDVSPDSTITIERCYHAGLLETGCPVVGQPLMNRGGVMSFDGGVDESHQDEASPLTISNSVLAALPSFGDVVNVSVGARSLYRRLPDGIVVTLPTEVGVGVADWSQSNVWRETNGFPVLDIVCGSSNAHLEVDIPPVTAPPSAQFIINSWEDLGRQNFIADDVLLVEADLVVGDTCYLGGATIDFQGHRLVSASPSLSSRPGAPARSRPSSRSRPRPPPRVESSSLRPHAPLGQDSPRPLPTATTPPRPVSLLPSTATRPTSSVSPSSVAATPLMYQHHEPFRIGGQFRNLQYSGVTPLVHHGAGTFTNCVTNMPLIGRVVSDSLATECVLNGAGSEEYGLFDEVIGCRLSLDRCQANLSQMTGPFRGLVNVNRGRLAFDSCQLVLDDTGYLRTKIKDASYRVLGETEASASPQLVSSRANEGSARSSDTQEPVDDQPKADARSGGTQEPVENQPKADAGSQALKKGSLACFLNVNHSQAYVTHCTARAHYTADPCAFVLENRGHLEVGECTLIGDIPTATNAPFVFSNYQNLVVAQCLHFGKSNPLSGEVFALNTGVVESTDNIPSHVIKDLNVEGDVVRFDDGKCQVRIRSRARAGVDEEATLSDKPSDVTMVVSRATRNTNGAASVGSLVYVDGMVGATSKVVYHGPAPTSGWSCPRLQGLDQGSSVIMVSCWEEFVSCKEQTVMITSNLHVNDERVMELERCVVEGNGYVLIVKPSRRSPLFASRTANQYQHLTVMSPGGVPWLAEGLGSFSHCHTVYTPFIGVATGTTSFIECTSTLYLGLTNAITLSHSQVDASRQASSRSREMTPPTRSTCSFITTVNSYVRVDLHRCHVEVSGRGYQGVVGTNHGTTRISAVHHRLVGDVTGAVFATTNGARASKHISTLTITNCSTTVVAAKEIPSTGGALSALSYPDVLALVGDNYDTVTIDNAYLRRRSGISSMSASRSPGQDASTEGDQAIDKSGTERSGVEAAGMRGGGAGANTPHQAAIIKSNYGQATISGCYHSGPIVLANEGRVEASNVVVTTHIPMKGLELRRVDLDWSSLHLRLPQGVRIGRQASIGGHAAFDHRYWSSSSSRSSPYPTLKATQHLERDDFVDDVSYASSWADIMAIGDTSTILLTADIVAKDDVADLHGSTLDGQGYSITLNDGRRQSLFTSGGVFQNLIVRAGTSGAVDGLLVAEGGGTFTNCVVYVNSATQSAFIGHNNAVSTFTNCTTIAPEGSSNKSLYGLARLSSTLLLASKCRVKLNLFTGAYWGLVGTNEGVVNIDLCQHLTDGVATDNIAFVATNSQTLNITRCSMTGHFGTGRSSLVHLNQGQLILKTSYLRGDTTEGNAPFVNVNQGAVTIEYSYHLGDVAHYSVAVTNSGSIGVSNTVLSSGANFDLPPSIILANVDLGNESLRSRLPNGADVGQRSYPAPANYWLASGWIVDGLGATYPTQREAVDPGSSLDDSREPTTPDLPFHERVNGGALLLGNSRVLTPKGYVTIEHLAAGMKVSTPSGGVVKVAQVISSHARRGYVVRVPLSAVPRAPLASPSQSSLHKTPARRDVFFDYRQTFIQASNLATEVREPLITYGVSLIGLDGSRGHSMLVEGVSVPSIE